MCFPRHPRNRKGHSYTKISSNFCWILFFRELMEGGASKLHKVQSPGDIEHTVSILHSSSLHSTSPATRRRQSADRSNAPSPQQQQPRPNETQEENEWLENIRGSLIVMATMIATLTYGAGLNPPGADCVTTDEGKIPIPYVMFRLFNGAAFALSTAIILVLMRRSVSNSRSSIQALQVLMGGNIVALTLAYEYGSPFNFTRGYNPVSIPILVLFSLILTNNLVVYVASLAGSKMALKFGDFMTNITGSGQMNYLKAAMFVPAVLFYLLINIYPDYPPGVFEVPMNIFALLGSLLWWYSINRNC